jgi:PhnB protein
MARKKLSKAKKKGPAMKKKTKKPAAKKKKVSPVPKGFHTVTPYLVVDGGMRAIDFYKKVFGAKASFCMTHEDGKLGHAELTIGDSKVMLSDVCPEMQTRGPKDFGGSPISIYLYVKNADAVFDKAIANGAKVIKPVENQFYGDRSGGFEDPFGHMWFVATHIEDLSSAKIKKRAAEIFGK